MLASYSQLFWCWRCSKNVERRCSLRAANNGMIVGFNLWDSPKSLGDPCKVKKQTWQSKNTSGNLFWLTIWYSEVLEGMSLVYKWWLRPGWGSSSAVARFKATLQSWIKLWVPKMVENEHNFIVWLKNCFEDARLKAKITK